MRGCMIVLLLSACSSAAGGPDAAPPDALPGCPTLYGSPPMETAAVEELGLIEVSGMAASRQNPGVLWMHNDSGGQARIYASDTDGRALGFVNMAPVQNIDFEDMAIATCPDASGPCLWVADTGNNTFDRTDQALYAVTEPSVSATQVFGEIAATRVWRFAVSFPGPAVDCEAFAMAADGSLAVFFEKIDADTARVFLYTAPFDENGTASLVAQASLTSPGLNIMYGRMITGADLHPSGTRLVVRLYTGLFEYSIGSLAALSYLSTLSPTITMWGPATEPQGESVTYDESGNGLWSISEDPNGTAPQPLHHYGCLPASP